MTKTSTAEKKKLPDDWRWVKLGEVCNIYQPETISLAQIQSSPGPYKVFGANGVIGHYSRYNHDQSEVLLTCRGATCGTVNRSENNCWITGNSMVVHPKEDILIKNFLFWVLKRSVFDEAQSGSAQPQITRRLLSPIEIPLPPLHEQKRIAAWLNEQMATVEKARAAADTELDAAKALRTAYLRSVFNSREANRWSLATIADVSSLVIDGPHVTPTYESSGIPFLTVRNIVNRKIDLSNVSYVSARDHAVFSGRGKAEKGDILYTKDGTLGIPCVVDAEMAFSFFVSVALIKLNKKLVNTHFIAYALESPFVMEQVKRLGAGAGLKHMVLKSIRALEIPVPPLFEQERIAEFLTDHIGSIGCLEKSLKEKRHTIDMLPAALLRRAFNGEM